MISIFTAVQETMIDQSSGEDSELIKVDDTRPELGQTITMGGDRPWQIVKVEAYKNEGKTVYIAMVVPQESVALMADESQWNVPYILHESPCKAFYVNLSTDDKLINYGWDFTGVPPSGSLFNYEPVEGHETLMRPVPSEWVVSEVDECLPTSDEQIFDMVYICHCEKQPIAA